MLELTLASTALTSGHHRLLTATTSRGSSSLLRAPPPIGRAMLSNEMLQDSWSARFTRFLSDPAPPPGTLILLRHGASEARAADPRSFVGWSDPDLSEVGEQQSLEAARAIKEAGYTFDITYCSMLKRAIRTTWLLLMELDSIHKPCWKTWRLNERCYGALTGEPVDDIVAKYGADTVASWRRSFDSRPPPFDPAHPCNPSGDPRYRRWYDRRGIMRPVAIPNGESMKDTIQRCLPVWRQEILPDLRRGKSVLVVAHANSIRAIVQSIDGLPQEDLQDLEIPVGIPLVYRFERESALENVVKGAGLAPWLPSWTGLRRRRTKRVALQELANLVPVAGENSAMPLSGEYLAKPTVRGGCHGHHHLPAFFASHAQLNSPVTTREQPASLLPAHAQLASPLPLVHRSSPMRRSPCASPRSDGMASASVARARARRSRRSRRRRPRWRPRRPRWRPRRTASPWRPPPRLGLPTWAWSMPRAARRRRRRRRPPRTCMCSAAARRAARVASWCGRAPRCRSASSSTWSSSATARLGTTSSDSSLGARPPPWQASSSTAASLAGQLPSTFPSCAARSPQFPVHSSLPRAPFPEAPLPQL